MPEIPRTKFNSPWTVAVIEAALNDVSSAKGSSESLTAALNAMRAEINSLSGGVHLKGAVDYYSDLPANPSEGDAYTVRYQGTSGTDPLGIEYAWATYQGTPQWIPIGVDPSVFAKQTEMDAVANRGAKNLLRFDETSTDNNNVRFTVNADGSITATEIAARTATAIFKMRYTDNLLSQDVRGKILSGCPSGGSDSTYKINIERRTSPYTNYGRDTGNGLLISDAIADDIPLYLYIQVYSTATLPLTFKPMIRQAAITDPTFQPYSKTNRELTVLTDEDRAALVEIVDGGDKNKFLLDEIGKIASTHGTVIDQNGVKYTVNADKTIRVQGTATSGAWIYFWDSATNAAKNFIEFFDGKHVATINRGSIPIILFYAIDGGSSISIDDGEILPNLSGTTAVIGVQVNKNSVVNPEQTIYPMICTSSAWKISQAYQPYRPSWQEMWDAIQALQSGGNRALTMQTEPEEQEER